MVEIKNHLELVEVLSNLDCEEYIPIKIGNTTMDLFFDTEIDKFVVFDNCEWIFDTLDEMENYIQLKYFCK